MSRLALILRSLVWHWPTHVGVVVGAAVATMMLVGALVVGDSVRQSLREIALQRLGETTLAMQTGERLVREELAKAIGEKLDADLAPVFQLGGTVVTPDGTARASNVQVLGVDHRFWKLGGKPIVLSGETCAINTELAEQLNAQVDDVIVVRMIQPSALPRDAPLATVDDAVAAVRLTVKHIVDADQLGRFNLRADHVAPMNLFLPLDLLQDRLDEAGAINVVLTADDVTAEAASAAANEAWQLADVDFTLRRVGDSAAFELRSERVFFEAPDALPGPRYLTYLVNALEAGDASTPYSMVTATDDEQRVGDLADDQMVITRWLADDLGVGVGDQVTLRFFVMGPMRELIEASSTFTVARIVAIDGAFADPSLMPAFPGLVDAERNREWDPGFAIDTSKIRDKDEDYWDAHRGTPKAYITLSAGRSLWANRFGDTTAVRFETGASAGRVTVHSASDFVRERLDVAEFGLRFEPVREQALASSQQGPAAYFGYMFIGFSFFIIAAAALLMAMLFVFSIEQRTAQIGTLKAIGYTVTDVRRLLLGEGVVLAVAGVVLGAAMGIGYTRLVLYGLATWWADAINSASITYHATLGSVIGGAVASLMICIAAMTWTLRRRLRLPARTLMAGDVSVGASASNRLLWPLLIGWVGVIGAAVLVLLSADAQGAAQAGAFFGAGFVLLVAAGAWASVLLRWVAGGHGGRSLTMLGLAIRNTTRRRNRSMAVIVLLAAGVFLVIAVSANRKSASVGIENRSGPAGGYDLIAEATLPIYHGLHVGDDGQADPQLADATVLPIRVADGDDASCLNLNRAATPRLLGVGPPQLEGRFTISDAVNEASWRLLDQPTGDPRLIPAVADKPTAMWGLGLSIGDTLTYTDERGRPFTVKLVGLIESSILQGNILIPEDAFTRLYPSTSGYRMFLIDAPTPSDISKHLTRRYGDRGMTVTAAEQRLAAFLSVENTYLSIFQSLGGLGLLIGTVGLGVVVLRNMLERRQQLALLRAVGYQRGTIGRLVTAEHVGLLAVGAIAGVGAAALAVWPAVTGAGNVVPLADLAAWLLVILLVGLLSVIAATWAALRGPLLPALREE